MAGFLLGSRPDKNADLRQFRIVNRDDFPEQLTEHKLPDGAPFQIVSRSSTAPEPRTAPIYFDVDPAVGDAVEEHRIRFETFAETRLGASFTLALPAGSVLTEGFFVADVEGHLVSDSFRALGLLGRHGFREVGQRRLERQISSRASLPGTAVVLGIQTNANYFHWLLEALPRLWLARHLGLLESATVLAPRLLPWMAEMAAACGLPLERMRTPDTEEARCELLIMPARGLWNIHTFTWHAFAMVEDLVRDANASGRRRLFVSRQRAASRRIVNEDEIFAIAARHGFERVFPEDMSFAEQMALFAGAEMVAGALGAGLTNAVFMAPGSSLLEFAPEGRQGDAVLFANLAHHRGLRYAGVVGSFLDDPARPFDRRNFNIPATLAAEAFTCLSRTH
jgi:capsular polysaccharide biosynthesis protein